MKDKAIMARSLTKFYGDLLAVDHIDFSIQKGEIFGFLGPNGAGKTTTIRMLTGLLQPDEGEATILGIDIVHSSIMAKRLMGVVPEVCNVYVDLSAWNNLMLMGKLYSVPARERKKRSKELLEKFGLSERKDEKTRRFSRGMKQRLILAMSLIHRPSILFLDEPTSGLDVQSSRMIRQIITELKREGCTVFLTTHNIGEANLMCDRVAIIDRGKIVATDTPEKLKSGIQKTQSVEVAFDNPPSRIDWLKNIPEVDELQQLGDKFRLYTSDPDVVIHRLAEYSKKNNLHFVSLKTLGPSLEDVLVKFTQNAEVPS
ncbi:Linearmycin resistance ATP-binding protein LnrL [subsurface metagenome]